MPVNDIFIINGTRYNAIEVQEKKLNPFLKVLGKAKKDLSDLLLEYTPSNETSYLVTSENGNISFEYSVNCDKNKFIQSAKNSYYIKHVIDTQDAIIF